jgi:hypothetical protein
MTSDKSIHLSTTDITELVHFAHFIPISKGLSQKYVAENYPGWEWNDILPVLIEKGILIKVKSPGYANIGDGLYISKKTKGVTIHFVSKNVDIET